MLVDNKFQLNKYLIKQKSLVNTGKYYIQDENGHDILFASSPMFQINWKVTIFDSESKQKHFSVAQGFSLMSTVYLVVDANNAYIGKIKGKPISLGVLWDITDANDVVIGQAREKVGSVAVDNLINSRKFANFDILLDQNVVGEVMSQITIKDTYILDLRNDFDKRLDRRMGIALIIALDAGLNR